MDFDELRTANPELYRELVSKLGYEETGRVSLNKVPLEVVHKLVESGVAKLDPDTVKALIVEQDKEEAKTVIQKASGRTTGILQ